MYDVLVNLGFLCVYEVCTPSLHDSVRPDFKKGWAKSKAAKEKLGCRQAEISLAQVVSSLP
jgi:hypothetical protein